MTNRRGFLKGLAGIAAAGIAPAYIKAEILMPARNIVVPEPFFGPDCVKTHVIEPCKFIPRWDDVRLVRTEGEFFIGVDWARQSAYSASSVVMDNDAKVYRLVDNVAPYWEPVVNEIKSDMDKMSHK